MSTQQQVLTSTTTTIMDKSNLPPAPPPPYAAMRFPRDFGFYRSSRSNAVIALHKNDNSLFYISTHSGWSSQPSVVLHNGPSPSHAPLATAEFGSFSSSIDIQVGNDVVRLNHTGIFTAAYSFAFPIGSTGKLETFEWRPSSGQQVQGLDGSSHGMKLVHVGSGTTVAAWTRPHSGPNKLGKMRFTANDRESLGNMWEFMAVISIAAIMEKKRRRRNSNAGMAGGAASC
jgi:hypothetical protein